MNPLAYSSSNSTAPVPVSVRSVGKADDRKKQHPTVLLVGGLEPVVLNAMINYICNV